MTDTHTPADHTEMPAGPLGYLIFALSHPHPWEKGPGGAWGIDHLVRYHGWSEADARAPGLEPEDHHLRDHYGEPHAEDGPVPPRELPIPHTHGDFVLHAIEASEYSDRLKRLLSELLEVVKDEELWGAKAS